jgi:hypothetical protein
VRLFHQLASLFKPLCRIAENCEKPPISAMQQHFFPSLQRHGLACLNLLQMRINVRFARFDEKAKKIVD